MLDFTVIALEGKVHRRRSVLLHSIRVCTGRKKTTHKLEADLKFAREGAN